jgi:competence protein ComEC
MAAGGSGFAMGGARQFLQSGRRMLGRALLAERDRWALWIPVAVGTGVAVYFDLPSEPHGAIAIGLFVVSIGLFFMLRRWALGRIAAIGLVALAAGFAAAQLRTTLVASPVLNQKLDSVRLEGRVRDVEFLPNGRRLRLGEVIIPGLSEPPGEIRLRLVSLEPPLVPGDWVRLKATLGPPSRPVAPGAYDFRRDLFFDRIGAIGFYFGRARLIDPGVTGDVE